VNSGLLCAIDGFPRTGCASTDTNGTYTYWSYWGAVGNTWQYATTGPIGHVLADGAVEGWRFGNGRGTSQDDAPRASVTASRCPTATAPPAQPAPTPNAAPPTGSGGSVAPVQGASGSHAATPGAAAAATAATPVASAPTTTVAGQPAVAPVPGAANASTTTTTAPVVVKGATEQRAGSVTIHPDDGGSTGWIPTIAGIGAVGAAAAGVVILRRRRLRGES
jgi:hypothetical protein